jgi:hypothetical protein
MNNLSDSFDQTINLLYDYSVRKKLTQTPKYTVSLQN